MTKFDDLQRRWRRDADYKEADDGLSQSQPGTWTNISRHVVRASRAKGRSPTVTPRGHSRKRLATSTHRVRPAVAAATHGKLSIALDGDGGEPDCRDLEPAEPVVAAPGQAEACRVMAGENGGRRGVSAMPSSESFVWSRCSEGARRVGRWHARLAPSRRCASRPPARQHQPR